MELVAKARREGVRYANTIFAGLERRDQIRVPASVVVEAGIAAERHNYGKRLTALVGEIQPEVVPLTAAIAAPGLP